jgi:sodium transport system permease protein
MMAIFTLVSAFVGGMNVAMDTVAGERERKSLLPLLLNAVPRERIVIGKWLAVSFFALAGLTINTLGFAVVLAISGIHPAVGLGTLLLVAWGLFALPLLAASIQLFISTASHAVKEAQTYLSLVVFAPMAIGMFLVFSPSAKHEWLTYLPLVGQQMQLESLMNGREIGTLPPLVLGIVTVILVVLVLRISTNRLHRDEILYGN